MLKYYDFSGVSFLVDKSFECENASENAAEHFVQPGCGCGSTRVLYPGTGHYIYSSTI